MTLEGTVTTTSLTQPDQAVEQALAALTIRLRRQKPDGLLRTANNISFKAGMLRFVASWNLLAPITAGEFTVTSEGPRLTIKYKLTFTQMVVVGTVMVLWLGASSWQASYIPLFGKILFPLSMWLWLVGGNYLSTAIRFPNYLRSALVNPPTAAEAARYPEPEYPEYPDYGSRFD